MIGYIKGEAVGIGMYQRAAIFLGHGTYNVKGEFEWKVKEAESGEGDSK